MKELTKLQEFQREIAMLSVTPRGKAVLEELVKLSGLHNPPGIGNDDRVLHYDQGRRSVGWMIEDSIKQGLPLIEPQ